MRSFIEHFKQVTIRRKQVPIGAAAVALYYTLCEYDNELFWMDNFTVPNGAIAAYAGLSLDTLKRVRAELVTKGYIEYQNGAGNQAGKYLIVDFAPQTTPQSAPQITPQTTPQSAPQHTIKEDKDKEEDKGCIGAASPPKRQSAPRFVPPTVEDVAAYCRERSNNIDPEHFVAYYGARGWMLGKGKMKSWKQTVITWEKNDKQRQGGGTPAPDYNDPAAYRWEEE